MMPENRVKDALLLQKRELATRFTEPYIDRGPGKIGGPLITAIIGPRRAGKSFFAVHALRQAGGFGYANFDDETLISVSDYNTIVTALSELYDKPDTLLFDEIQNLPKWELFVNRLQRQGYRIVITGSNSRLLSTELATHLTGRHRSISIFPFSFKEVLAVRKKEQTVVETKAALDAYLSEGGYPEPYMKGVDRRDYLSSMFTTTLYNDIVKKFRVRSAQALEDLAVYLLSNIAKEYSTTTLSTVTRCKSPHTVEKYLRHLEDTFLFFRVPRFSSKVKEQAAAPKKVYCIDNGLIGAKGFVLSPDRGMLFENAVAVALKKQELAGQHSVYYWKNVQQEEVDFVLKRGHTITELIQVCAGLSQAKDREVRALLKASRDLRCRALTVITGEEEGTHTEEWFGIRRVVHYIPLWKWLLDHD